jgi:hypothetical protein
MIEFEWLSILFLYKAFWNPVGLKEDYEINYIRRLWEKLNSKDYIKNYFTFNPKYPLILINLP